MNSANMQNASTQFTTEAIAFVRYLYFDFWKEKGDKRVEEYPFMNGGPWSMLTTIIFYIYLVKSLGPELMKNRKPFNLRSLMVFYNFLMVAFSAWMFAKGCSLTNFGLNLWCCQEVDYTSTTGAAVELIEMGWVFFVTKFIEFIDTFFFVLRKKQNQVTHLHVIHHSLVPISVWIGLKFAPGGNNAMFPLLNSFVHTIMYFYYGLSAIGPQMQPYLRWKRYLTSIQMLQFVIVIIYGLRALVMYDCEFPKSFLLLNLSNAILFLILFQSFYMRSYIKKQHIQ
ncbi:elongation of very long chain fatty acids protein-like protein [Leptotrombidium deliense]|uniref:Elongation of very long chain fatty acids protein n=1 Tax=Leptotrombidium deliense TaxID=299467 RepID=A0A443S6G6_9ACAR|nr:elongation of very long chain fatty acids protein-like protein [Leptotrombidium deliense]